MENQAGPTSVTWPTFREISRSKIKQRRTCLAFENQPCDPETFFFLYFFFFLFFTSAIHLFSAVAPTTRFRGFWHRRNRVFSFSNFSLVVERQLGIENWYMERLRRVCLVRWSDFDEMIIIYIYIFFKSIHRLIESLCGFVLNSKEINDRKWYIRDYEFCERISKNSLEKFQNICTKAIEWDWFFFS